MIDTDFRKRFEVDAFLDDKEVVEDQTTGALTMKERAPKLAGEDLRKIGDLDIVGYDIAGNQIEINSSNLPDWVTFDTELPDIESQFSMGDAYTG